MTVLRIQKTTFAAGEISPLLRGRGDLRAYENGAARLRNVFVHPTGGVSRRHGLRYVDTARGAGRLIAFEFNTEQTYALVFTDTHCDVYKDGVNVADFAAPWTEAQLALVNWTQSADTLLIVHPDVPPKKITRTSDAAWTLADWAWFADDNGRIERPHHAFAGDDVTLQPSATTGSGITLTASAAVFFDDHVGVRFRLQDKEVEVTAVPGGGEPYTTATADVVETLVDTTASTDWSEWAFSAVRGWPVAATFHQDRLVIGGSRDLPNRLWLSKSGDLFNFDLGEALDDEAIEFQILSDQVNAIRGLFSGRHLQVFTSGAEWMVTGAPLTPTSIQLARQTRVGSPVDRGVRPVNIDGATVFASRNADQVREFLFSDVEQAYQAGEPTVVAGHILGTIVDMDYDDVERWLHVVLADGGLATLTVYRAEQVAAWTRQATAGSFLSVARVGTETYVLVDRSGAVLIERFDAALHTDAGLDGTDATPKTVWTGLDHLEGETVKVVADGGLVVDAVVSSGAITLAEPASAVEAGLGFTHEVEPLPPAVEGGGEGRAGRRLRPLDIEFLLHETQQVIADFGSGLAPVPLRPHGALLLDAPPPKFSGAVSRLARGWSRYNTRPVWRIEQDVPMDFTLLSVSAEIVVNS